MFNVPFNVYSIFVLYKTHTHTLSAGWVALSIHQKLLGGGELPAHHVFTLSGIFDCQETPSDNLCAFRHQVAESTSSVS